MDDHAARLVDNDKIAVLIDNVDRNILCNELHVHRLGEKHLDGVVLGGTVIFLDSLTVYENVSVIY